MASYATDSNQAELKNSFIDQGELVAMKTLSGCKNPHCDKHQFCDKMTVNSVVLTRKKNEKMAFSLPHIFAFSCLPRDYWALI